MKPSYSERDYTFGQAMLTLRTAIGLTQAGLANHLGVSRRAVGEWEAGSSYPKVEHLKEMIILGVEQRAFASGQETEEIRQLWKAARQKVLLDEQWLSALLYLQRSPHPHTAPVPVPIATPTISAEETKNTTSAQAHPASGPRVDWGDALSVPAFYGREEEQAQLTQWMVQERCRVVSVLGMGGIGKSALSVSIMYQISRHFEVVIFRPLRDTPSCETLLDECLQVLSPEPVRSVPASLEQRMSLFLERLHETRALVVLDNLESLLQEGDVRGRLRPGLEGYGQLLQRVARTAHQSCLLLTSREKAAELRPLEGKLSHSSVRSLRLGTLGRTACKQLLEEKELIGTELEQESLIEAYGGNPLALKIVGETIFDLFGGEIGPFLAEGTVVFGSITGLLSEQFGRLSPLEQSVLCWLAIVREPATLDELLALQVTPPSRVQILEAIDAGYRRSLIERGKRAGSFTLQSVVLEYVTALLIAEGSREIQQRKLVRLIEHGLSQAHAKEYVRQTQERLLLFPLLADLQSAYPRRAVVGGRIGASPLPPPKTTIEEQLLALLDELREQEDFVQGYGPTNLIVLLRLLRRNLSCLDLSQLSIRGAYLQGIEMHETSLRGAMMRDTVWTEASSAAWSVAISPDGKLWAAGNQYGQVYVREEESQALLLVWQAHTTIVPALVFSPHGRALASAGWDSTVKLWDVEKGTLLWTNWHEGGNNVAFSPDSRLLASGGLDTTVRLWDPQTGKLLQTLTHPSSIWAVVWSPDGRLLASGSNDGTIHVWERRETESSTCVEFLLVQTTSQVIRLAFAPDGRTLASTHWDLTAKLWEIPSGSQIQTLPEHLDYQVNCIAWSPDGRTLAIGSYEKAVRFWDVKEGRYRAALHGHTADIAGVAFTPDGNRLLTGGLDSTLRVWDVETAQCVRVIAGYMASLCDLDWSPDGMYLVSGDAAGLVTIWDMGGAVPSRKLHGHTLPAWGTAWSPDGRLVASCGSDGTIRLWDPTSGACVQRAQHSCAMFVDVAWSPDSTLLAGATSTQGIQIWDVREPGFRQVEQTPQTGFRRAAWSPDGTRFISGGQDGCMYLWKTVEGTGLEPRSVPERLQGEHQGRVTDVAWSRDGRLVASCGGKGESGELLVWDGVTGEHVEPVMRYRGEIYVLVWSPNGDRLVSGGSDGMLCWWDVKTGECVNMREAHKGTIQSLQVSPDGKRLASCGDDGAIMIWDLESFEHLQTLRHDRPYERLNITGIRGLTEAQKESLQALGAIEGGVP